MSPNIFAVAIEVNMKRTYQPAIFVEKKPWFLVSSHEHPRGRKVRRRRAKGRAESQLYAPPRRLTLGMIDLHSGVTVGLSCIRLDFLAT